MPELKSVLPIFEKFSIGELAERLGYTESYLVMLKDGYRKPPRRFKLTAAGILNRPVAELFGPEED